LEIVAVGEVDGLLGSSVIDMLATMVSYFWPTGRE